MDLATLYIILGSVSFIACVSTFVVLIKKFLDQPPPHCFFSYSDIIASALLSLALLLDGVIGLVPTMANKSCYHFKLLYGLYVVAIVTCFFSVLGIAIERFHMFAVVRDYSAIKRKFSIIWFLSSWTLSIVFVIILLPQIRDKTPVTSKLIRITITTFPENDDAGYNADQLNYVAASNIFPGPHTIAEAFNTSLAVQDPTAVIIEKDDSCQEAKDNATEQQRINDKILFLRTNVSHIQEKKKCPSRFIPEDTQHAFDQSNHINQKCVVEEKFIRYYFLLLFLICFLTPVLITISLNFFISLAVRNTKHETISHHQWLTLSACVLMWGPSLIQLLLEKTFTKSKMSFPEPVSVFLFLLGHMHNLLRSVSTSINIRHQRMFALDQCSMFYLLII